MTQSVVCSDEEAALVDGSIIEVDLHEIGSERGRLEVVLVAEFETDETPSRQFEIDRPGPNVIKLFSCRNLRIFVLS
jgi:hypothetical protein